MWIPQINILKMSYNITLYSISYLLRQFMGEIMMISTGFPGEIKTHIQMLPSTANVFPTCMIRLELKTRDRLYLSSKYKATITPNCRRSSHNFTTLLLYE